MMSIAVLRVFVKMHLETLNVLLLLTTIAEPLISVNVQLLMVKCDESEISNILPPPKKESPSRVK